MSDFGANIFGPDEPPAPPRRPPKQAAPPPPPAPAPTPAPPARERPAPAARPADGDHARPPRARQDEAPRPEPRREPQPHADRRDHRDTAPRGFEPPRHEPRRHDRPDHAARRPERAPHDRPEHGPRHGPRPPQPAARPPVAAPGAAGGRVALLVDLAALRDEARTQGAELSQHKLRNGIANHRPVQRAVGFVPAGAPVPSGFEAVAADAGFGGGVQFAALAVELLAAADHLVLVPATPAAVQLAQALRRAGHEVELAGLGTAAPGDLPVRRLGRDCLFVP